MTLDPEEPEDETTRKRDNIVLLIIFAVSVVVGAWLLLSLADLRKAQDCLGQGRRNCAPLDIPAPSRRI